MAYVNLLSSYGFSPTATAAANTTALNSAITDSSSGTAPPVIQFDSGTFNLNAPNTINGNAVVLQGAGGFSNGTELVFNNATGDCLVFSTSGHMGIRDMYLTTNVNRTSGNAIKFTGSCFKPFMERVRIDYHYNGVNVDACSELLMDNVTFRYLLGAYGINVGGGSASLVSGWRARAIDGDNPYPGNNNGTRVTWSTSTAFSVNEIINNNGNFYQCTTAGTSAATGSGPSGVPGTNGVNAFTTGITDGTVTWKFVCSSSLTWFLVDSFAYSGLISGATALDGSYGLLMQDTVNNGSSWPKWIDIFDLECDHNYGTAMMLSEGEGLFASNCWFGSCLTGNGAVVNTNFKGDAVIRGSRVVGNWEHGMLLQSGPVACNFEANSVYQNSQEGSANYHGIVVAAGATQFAINNNISGEGADGSGQQGYGIVVATGASNHYAIVGNLVSGNVIGGLSNGGTGAQQSVGNNPT